MLSMITESSLMGQPFQIPSNGTNHGRSAQPASTSAYQAPTQTPTLMSQSLEETLRDFMNMTGQSISGVKSATMVNTQAIAKLEMQMGQLASHLGERDKGNFPSQPKPNPKAFAIGNSSSLVHRQEHVQAIVTLRTGRQMDNHVVDPKVDTIGQEGETRRKEMLSHL
jgi:hypothetical protein